MHPADRAVIAGDCVIAIEAFFKEGFAFPNPVEAAAGGAAPTPSTGDALTQSREPNKFTRNVAIAYLVDLKATFAETFSGFNLTRFDGQATAVE